MPASILPIRDIVIEWRYPANLAVYSAMDKVGAAFKESFPDWQRTALSLELRDKKSRRRFAMTHNRTFFHVANPVEAAIEVEKSIALFDCFVHETQTSTISRVSVRQWLTFPIDVTFEELTKTCVKRFQSTGERLKALLRGKVEDIMYHVEVAHNDGWRYNLRVGPMLKAQWFEAVAHEEAAFADPQAYNLYKEEIPETFLFVDLDGWNVDVLLSDSKQLVRRITESSRSIFADIQTYVKEG